MESLIKSKTFPKNHVIYRMRDYGGRLTGVKSQPYDGTLEDMMRQMSNLQSKWEFLRDDVSGINSQNFATDENGQLKWVIAPNCLSVAEIGTSEARYILGDISARQKCELEKEIESA